MLNKDNILAVADAIEQHSIPDLGFNMGWWHFTFSEIDDVDNSGHHCGTVACIGGWTDAVFGIVNAGENATAAMLGLTKRQATDLFYPHERWGATHTQAVRVLRHLAETGEVDWSVAS